MKRQTDPDVLLLQAAADPTRLEILRQLSASDAVCACDFTDCCDVSQPTISHHLRVLRQAGWGDGFRIVLHATSDRYPNDAAIAQAIAQMWTRIGLKAEVEALPGAVFFTRASKQEFSAFTSQYGAEDAMNSLRALVATADPARG